MKKQKQKTHKKSSYARKKGKKTVNPSSWVEELLNWKASDNENDVSLPVDVSLVCWNVLADSYCNQRSHKHLPMKYQRHVFDRQQRQHHVRQTLRRFVSTLEPDLVALQEVDPPLEVATCMNELNFQGVETPSSPGGKNGRVDACALYYRQDRWHYKSSEVVFLDELATMSSRYANENPSVVGKTNLMGLQTSFVRKNMALLVRLEHLDSNRELVVAVVHLFWNPSYEYVKLCQAHHILERAKAFSDGSPFILCGDFNSQPSSYVYQYLTRGWVNAKLVAPWYYTSSDKREGFSTKDISSTDGRQVTRLEDSGLSLCMESLSISKEDNSEIPCVKYMLDYTLNRFCRWLRILGIDAALETEEEERLRTKQGKFVIFNRCKQENRTLVTTSTRLLLRKDCPPGAYLLDTKSLSNLEVTLVHLLLSHGVTLQPRKFLTRCVVCNGQIQSVQDEEKIQTIFESHQAPKCLNEEIFEVFQCSDCKQGYWWCDRPTSSASRVKSQATKIFKTCIRGGVKVVGDMAMFDFVDVEEVKSNASKEAVESFLIDQRLAVLQWLQEERLENPFGQMKSTYASKDGCEILPFTNVTSDFVGHLDYIFFQNQHLKVRDLLYVPTSLEALNSEDIRNGFLLPSNVWPSDHLAIGCRFIFSDTKGNSSTATG